MEHKHLAVAAVVVVVELLGLMVDTVDQELSYSAIKSEL